MTAVDALDSDACWQAVSGHDKAADGAFVYAVATTGIYCRPSCSSRRPRRENVRFFALPAAAEQHGFRACKRCRPKEAKMIDTRAALMQDIAQYLASNVDDSCEVMLVTLGTRFGYDPQHIQRMFKEALGLTPKQYVEGLRVQHFKNGLHSGGTVLDAGLAAGYGSSSRTYENGARALGMTPAAYKRGGDGIEIRYTAKPTALGVMLVAATERGISAVGLYGSIDEAEAALETEYPHADLTHDAGLGDAVGQILAHIENGAALNLPLDIQATAFQWRVWRALQAIPRGETRSYAQVAETIGQPSAARAVAGACAANPVALIIPCHRVVKRDGTLSGYRWGANRKQQILESEGT